MCSHSKKAAVLSGRFGDVDWISRLPDCIIHHIQSFLPVEDAARTCILSKAWKTVCDSYPIIHHDHNLFGLQLLCGEGGQVPQVDEIRDRFMDVVDCHLLRMKQENLPVRKLALKVAINDPKHFSRVDHWMDLVKQARVRELCLFVQTDDYKWEDEEIHVADVSYDLPFSVFASKELQCVSVSDCKFTGFKTDVFGFSSLQHLYMLHVSLDKGAVLSLMHCCPGIEVLDFDNCTFRMEVLELSGFPKLKRVSLSLDFDGLLKRVEVEATSLESFECKADVVCRIGPLACTSIRELNLESCTVDPPSILEDLTTSFPLLEKAEFDTDAPVRLRATSDRLKSLCFSTGNLEEASIDCPNLMQFIYIGHSVPNLLRFNSSVDVRDVKFRNDMFEDIEISWFIKLRQCLKHMGEVLKVMELVILSPMVTFDAKGQESIPLLPPHNIELSVTLHDRHSVESQASLVDGLLWSIRPATLTVYGNCYDFVKRLCDKLSNRSKDPCCLAKLCYDHWWHHVKDFEVKRSSPEITDIKENLPAFVELYRTTVCLSTFKFYWI